MLELCVTCCPVNNASLATASRSTTMKHTTQRDKADEEAEKIKSALKLTGLDYYMEESPFRLSIHIKKTYIQDFSPRLSADLPWTPVLSSTPTTSATSIDVTEKDSGLHCQESSCCPSCLDKDKQLEDMGRELVKVIVNSNETKNKIETAEFALEESNKKLKTVQAETVLLKNELKMKKDQLKQKNTTLESVKSKLDKNMKDHENSRDNFNNKIMNLEAQNEHLKKNIDEKK